MRTAGLPAFSKLALRNDDQTMKCGVYQLDIVNSGCFSPIGQANLTIK